MRRFLGAAALGACLWSSSAMADEYQSGFQDGWKAAAEAVMRNRDHFRSLFRLPVETHDEVIKRLYEKPIGTPGRGQTNVDRTADILADAVDLYVVLPLDGVMTPPAKAP